MEPNMDYEWKRERGYGRWRIPCLPRFARGIGTILAREIGTSTGRGFATSERGHLCHADLVVPAVAAAAAGMGYLGANRSKATWRRVGLVRHPAPVFRPFFAR